MGSGLLHLPIESWLTITPAFLDSVVYWFTWGNVANWVSLGNAVGASLG